jgi:hypothetical protein
MVTVFLLNKPLPAEKFMQCQKYCVVQITTDSPKIRHSYLTSNNILIQRKNVSHISRVIRKLILLANDAHFTFLKR